MDPLFVGLPVIDGHYVIHETPNVQYLLKNIHWIKQRRFKLDDHQFSLTGRVVAKGKTNESDPFADKAGEPLLVDCLDGLETSIENVLKRLRDYYNVRNVDKEERERTYVFVCHKQLDTAIIVSTYN